MSKFFVTIGLLFGLCTVGHVQAETIRGAANKPSNPGIWMAPDGTGQPVLPSEAQKRAAARLKISGSGINYNGGPVLSGTPKVYYIWYGNWAQTVCCSNQQAIDILRSFMSNISGSPWLNIDTTYYGMSGTTKTPVSNLISYNPITNDFFDLNSQGTSLSDTSINLIVQRAFSKGLPVDENALYFVLTAGDIVKSGFGTSYCGWHTRASMLINGVYRNIKYSFVGNPFPQYPTSCAAQSIGPNGNAGADAMASVIAHELVETISDPDLNAWYDSRGYENADKCAWKFGTTSILNSAYYNITLGSTTKTNWLIQQNWVNAGTGYCDVKYP